MRTVGRLIWVPIAFLISILAALFMLLTLGSERLTQAWAGRGLPEDTVQALFELASGAMLIISTFSIVPAVAVIVIGEIARLRGWLYYTLASGIASVSIPMLAKFSAAGQMVMPAVPVLQVFATAGFVGGFIYWALAGRNA